MNINITTLFDSFFDYQPIKLPETAACCKKYNINDFLGVCAVLCSYFGFDPKDEADKEYKIKSIRWEFVKALAFRICKMNGITYKQNFIKPLNSSEA